MVDLSKNKRVRMSEILEKIDERIYHSLNDLLAEIEVKFFTEDF